MYPYQQLARRNDDALRIGISGTTTFPVSRHPYARGSLPFVFVGGELRQRSRSEHALSNMRRRTVPQTPIVQQNVNLGADDIQCLDPERRQKRGGKREPYENCRTRCKLQ